MVGIKGSLLLTVSALFGLVYLAVFANALTYKDSQQLEQSLQDRGVVFWLVVIPGVVPAGVFISYIIWIGLKIYVHSPRQQ
mmetsp:Transcript_7209/g.11496  ORF Transcript_7209/g.11496 Transcript_7209/m.11496 type:complete len:81 (-) Transcript_7209:291-533(-)